MDCQYLFPARPITTENALTTLATPATITIPLPNVGQELYDVVTVTDPRCGIDQEKYRVLALRTDYDRRQARYDQTLTLGAP